MLKREKNQLKKDSDEKNISESDKKEILVKTVIREKYIKVKKCKKK